MLLQTYFNMKNKIIVIGSLVVLIAIVYFLALDDKSIEYEKSTETIEVENGNIFNLEAIQVLKSINGKEVLMLGYNGEIAGPLIKVKQGSYIYVDFKNSLPYETTVHWHGIRVENKYDGVP